MGYTVQWLYHATHKVPSLDDATEFFERVFGRPSTLLPEYLGSGNRPIDPQNRSDYAVFTEIADVLIESIDPTLHVLEGIQPAPIHEPHLETLAWFVDGMDDLWVEMKRRGIRGLDQLGREPEGDGPPVAVASPTPLIFTVPDEIGLRYELCHYMPHRDPRGNPPVPAVRGDDPLGILRCSHHTVLTDRPERALSLLRDVLGARVVHEGRNELLGTESVYVSLCEGIYELARPLEAGSPAMTDLQRAAPHDCYAAMTWKVRDLDRAVEHLRGAGVTLRSRTDTTAIVEPGSGFGIAWGFTTVDVPGDPRE